MPTQPPPLRKKSRWPLALSALIFPGAGQCLQGRWAAGLFFGSGFLLSFFALVLSALWPPLFNYFYVTLQLAGSGFAPQPSHEWLILGSLALTVLLYLWNVADACWRSPRPPTLPQSVHPEPSVRRWIS